MESHKINMGYQITQYDKNNNIKYEKTSFPIDESEYIIRIKSENTDIKMPMKSFTKNFIQEFHRYFLNYDSSLPSNILFLTSSGTISGGTMMFWPTPGLAGTMGGIVVGKGVNTGSIYNYNLNSVIPQGSGTNQLLYQSQMYVSPYESGSSYECYVMRQAINASSSSINVTEIAMFSSAPTPIMWTYDTINVSGSSININVPTGSTLSVFNYFAIGSGSYINYNFLSCLYSALFGQNINLTSSNGNIVTTSANHFRWYSYAGAGIDYNGILVGSGSEPMNLTGSRIHEKISHGTGEGQIYYGPMDLTTGNPYFPTTASMESFIQRSFINLNLTPVSVSETSLYINGFEADIIYNDNNKIMVARVLLDTPLTLQYQESISIRYIFKYQL